MILVKMMKKGYRAIDGADQLLWEDKAYSLLCSFVDADFATLRASLSRCVDAPGSYDFDDPDDRSDVHGLRDALYGLHPFLYYDNNSEWVIRLIAAFYLRRVWETGSADLEKADRTQTVSREEFIAGLLERIHPALEEELVYSDVYPVRNDMWEYDPVLGAADFPSGMESITLWLSGEAVTEDEFAQAYYKEYLQYKMHGILPEVIPGSIEELLSIQARLRRELYWILDVSTPRFSSLTIPQRAALYQSVFAGCEENATILPRRASFVDRFTYGDHRQHHLAALDNLTAHRDYPWEADEWTAMQAAKNEYPAQTKFRVSDEARDALLQMADDTIMNDEETNAELQRVITEASRDETVAASAEYAITDLYQLFFLEMEQLLMQGPNVKRCRHCNRYFITTDMKTEYADHIAPGSTKLCSEIGPARAFRKKLEEESLLLAYNKAYKAHFARKTRKRMSAEEWEHWREEARTKLDAARAGELTEDEFTVWLKL